MATASTIQLSATPAPALYREGISADATTIASRLLQENHDRHHIFFNHEGFHNHIAHHLLTLWAMRASPKSIQQGYDDNRSYQRPQAPPDAALIERLHHPAFFKSHLGPEKHYPAFLRFFQGEIEQHGWQAVIRKYLLAGDDLANDMLVRLYAGFLHPLIHLGFGIEFQQPAIIAEALAQTACHDNWIGDYLLPAEKLAQEQQQQPQQGSSASTPIVQLLDEIHADQTLASAATWADSNKIRDGILARARSQMLHYGSRVHVAPADLARRTAEMTNAVAYYTGGAQRADRAVKYDFYFMHCLNSSVFFSAFLQQGEWLREADRVRLLEWKIRMDLVMYASRKAPEVRLQDVRGYVPKRKSGWDGVEDRVCALSDDGHAVKLVRALANGQKICGEYEDGDEFRLKQEDWLQLAHMAIDSVEAPGENWIRSAGFDQAWEKVPPRAQL